MYMAKSGLASGATSGSGSMEKSALECSGRTVLFSSTFPLKSDVEKVVYCAPIFYLNIHSEVEGITTVSDSSVINPAKFAILIKEQHGHNILCI